MPEGPEVLKNTDFLNNELCGKNIVDTKIVSGRYLRHGPFDGFNVMKNKKLKINDVKCKGKFIYFNFSDGSSLWSTLGMSGVWQNKPTKHNRFIIKTDDTIIYYNDTRNFGTLKYVLSSLELSKKLSSLGPDILGSHINQNKVRERFLKKPNKTIAECLMDQSVISGVGNYLKAEILYACKISPNRLCKDISVQDYALIINTSRKIAKLSYEMGGATLSTYRQPNGKKGLYTRRFAVYNQKISPCGFEVVKEKTHDKRTTHWVPSVQI